MEKAYSREPWIDYLKIIACIFVVLGHFFQSMTKSNILINNNFLGWFDKTIYYFHVQLFFFASGYLYQKNSKVVDIVSYKKNISKKLLNLIVPYLTFSMISIIMKLLFSSDVNDKISTSILTILLNQPLAPYWYLYALFICFLLIPTFTDRKVSLIVFIFFIGLRILSGLDISVYAIKVLCNYGIFFLIGMLVCLFNLKEIFKKKFIVISYVFIPLSIFTYTNNIWRGNGVIDTVMSLLGMTMVIHLVSFITEDTKNIILNRLSMYTLPIFLMHTIFAAGIRSILFKLGITNSIIHIFMGLMFTFVGPIGVAIMCDKTTYMNFLVYPSRTINEVKGRRIV